MAKKKVTKKKSAKAKTATTSTTKGRVKKGADISGFKAMMARKFKNINWKKIGIYGLIGMILVGATGVFGPKVQIAAVMVIKNAVLA